MRVCCLAVCLGGILVRSRFGCKFALKVAELLDQALCLRDLCLRVSGFKASLRETLRSFGKVALLGHACVESCLVVRIGLVELGQEHVGLFEANVDGRDLVVAFGCGHSGVLERLRVLEAALSCRNVALGLGEGFACMGKLLYLLVKVLHERLCAGAGVGAGLERRLGRRACALCTCFLCEGLGVSSVVGELVAQGTGALLQPRQLLGCLGAGFLRRLELRQAHGNLVKLRLCLRGANAGRICLLSSVEVARELLAL